LKHLFFFVLLSTAIHLSAQTTWGKVSPEQFAVRSCPFDSTANAMVLLDSEYVSFKYTQTGLNAVYDVYKRIQIFNKEGFAYATVKIPYYSYLNAQGFESIEAQTISKDESGRIHVTKLKDNAFFDESSDNMSRKSFAFADVIDGSIIEYRYTLVSRTIGSLNDWLFQSDIPELRSAVTVKIPEYVHYSPTPMGNVLLNQYKSEPYNEIMSVNVRSKAGIRSEEKDVTGVINHYAMNNVPAMKEEAYITTINDYLARLTFPLYSITMPYEKVRTFGESWDVVVQELMKSQYFGLHLNEMIGDQLGAAKDITKGLTGNEAKARAIFAHVSGKMKWNNRFSLYPKERLSKTYNDGSGNSADINLLLISMLRAAGIKADPVLISTRDHEMIQRAYPVSRQFNNVIAMVELDTGTILLDATGTYNPYGAVNSNNLNNQGLRIVKTTEESYKGVWVEVTPSANSTSNIVSTIEIDGAGNQKLKTYYTTSDYPAVACRQDLEMDSVKECLKKHVKISGEYEVLEETVTAQKELDKKLRFAVSLEKKGTTSESKTLYVNPFPVKFMTENPFKLGKRTYPVDYGYPFQQGILTTIPIPEGFKISELPKSVKLKLEDGSASFTFLIGQSDNNIQVNSSLKINKSQFQPDMYEDLKALYAKMIDAYNSLIVLERIK
jgi:transglutaminase-like putative cysteine protease